MRSGGPSRLLLPSPASSCHNIRLRRRFLPLLARITITTSVSIAIAVYLRRRQFPLVSQNCRQAAYSSLHPLFFTFATLITFCVRCTQAALFTPLLSLNWCIIVLYILYTSIFIMPATKENFQTRLPVLKSRASFSDKHGWCVHRPREPDSSSPYHEAFETETYANIPPVSPPRAHESNWHHHLRVQLPPKAHLRR